MTRRTLIAAAAALCSSLPLAPALAQGALKPVDAMIVNPPTRPVPVTVLGDEGGREIFRVASFLDVEAGFGCAAIAVPAGKRMVLQHLGGEATVAAPAALIAVITRFGSGSFSDLVVPAAAPRGGAGFPNSSAAGQQVHAYYDNNFQVCASLSLEANGRVGYYLRGYLVNKP